MVQLSCFITARGEFESIRLCHYVSGEAGVASCNGMLHWVDAEEEDRIINGIVAFNPFNDIADA